MDKQSAKRFKLHIHEAIKELSSALLVAHEVCAAEEVAAIKKSMGDIIAAAEILLYDSIYSHHPELNELSRKPKET
jgi:hypothetical protein